MCPQWVSKDGKWFPAQEKVGLVDHEGKEGREPNTPFIYEGPDRAAMEELAKVHGVDETGHPKKDHIGMDFKDDPELIMRVKQFGYKDVMEYALVHGYNKEEVDKEFYSNIKKVSKHEAPTKKKARQIEGGGKDFSGGGKDKYGGFGMPEELK
jgi:hypothetical protein